MSTRDGVAKAANNLPDEPVDPRVAVLRWRLRWLLQSLPPRAKIATRFFPLLLHCSFERSEFRSEAPGIDGMKVRPGWGLLSRAAGLHPPVGYQRGRGLAEAVLALPGETPCLWVLPRPDLGVREIEVLKARIQAARAYLASFGVDVRVLEAPFPLELLAYGALVAGRLPQRFWTHLDEQVEKPFTLEHVMRSGQFAPTPVAFLLSLLLRKGVGPTLPSHLQSELNQGTPARLLADSEYLLLLWARRSCALRLEAEWALHLGAMRESTRKAAAPQPREIAPETLLLFARRLWVSARWTVRALPRQEKGSFSERLLRESVEGIPAFLAKQLTGKFGSTLTSATATWNGQFEVRDPPGALLSNAASADQATVRALSLLRSLQGNQRLQVPGFWQKILQKMAQRGDRRMAICVTLPRADLTAPVEEAVWVLMRPATRPTARRLKGRQILPTALVEIARGGTIEVLIGTDEPDPASSRLDRTLVQTAAARRLGHELALQDGGVVLCIDDNLVQRIPYGNFVARPRHHTFISGDPLVAHASFMGRRWSSPTIECQINTHDERRAAVEYLDGLGNHFRELVPLSHLDAHIRETQKMLRELPVPGLLAIRASAQVAAQATRNTDLPVVSIEVSGKLPFKLQLRFAGEVFGGSAASGWEAAATRILSLWPGNTRGRLSITRIAVDTPPGRAVSLQMLYVRSVVSRRLNSHLKRLT